MNNAVVLWTGGKDSCLALHLAREQGHNILALVIFVPVGSAEFTAHPQSEMKEQAKRLNLAIHFVEIKEPYKSSYFESMKWIKASLGSAIVITGDIDLVGGLWIN